MMGISIIGYIVIIGLSFIGGGIITFLVYSLLDKFGMMNRRRLMPKDKKYLGEWIKENGEYLKTAGKPDITNKEVEEFGRGETNRLREFEKIRRAVQQKDSGIGGKPIKPENGSKTQRRADVQSRPIGDNGISNSGDNSPKDNVGEIPGDGQKPKQSRFSFE